MGCLLLLLWGIPHSDVGKPGIRTPPKHDQGDRHLPTRFYPTHPKSGILNGMDEVSTFARILSQHGFQQNHLEMVIYHERREPGRLAVHRIRDGYRVILKDGKWRASATVEKLDFDSISAVLPEKLREKVKRSFSVEVQDALCEDVSS